MEPETITNKNIDLHKIKEAFKGPIRLDSCSDEEVETSVSENDTEENHGTAERNDAIASLHEALSPLSPHKIDLDESGQLSWMRRMGSFWSHRSSRVVDTSTPVVFGEESVASDLVTTFMAGSPAALLVPSNFLHDDIGTRRAPLLLQMLTVDVLPVDKNASRAKRIVQGENEWYDIKVQYGVGDVKNEWVVRRSYKDIQHLHSRLKYFVFAKLSQRSREPSQKLHDKNGAGIELPRFPRFGDLPEVHENASLSSVRSIKQTVRHVFRRNVIVDDASDPMFVRIKKYLMNLHSVLALHPQCNRLFSFYELSPIGTLLSYENGYQGKQGHLVIRGSAKSQGWRVGHLKWDDWKGVVQRHLAKWVLVRNSYVLYVRDIYSTTPLEVFMVDPKFEVTWNKGDGVNLITLTNSERKLKLVAKNETQKLQWVESFQKLYTSSSYAQEHRFKSFFPIRTNGFAKWFVDGRDYFWALSQALELAKDVIYIHDWWLSPELYLRRPPEANQEHRLDRTLKRLADRGVKVFIVVYRNVGSTVGTDSLWTKHSLLALHDNIRVIRSPNQWIQNTYFWAHHEKICVIDSTIAFIGGIDLCYGRYDTPQHVLADNEKDITKQVFPGKDYSNARVGDFTELDKWWEDMYDRSKVARMPWHDFHSLVVGEAARDLARHFVQRWNYLLRQKRPSRPTPLLTPPSELTEEELRSSPFFSSIKSTCEIQVVRSAGPWSLGLQEADSSIHTAYLKLIETSQHYVYIENQFFVTSASWEGITIENRIGDALVDRIILAHESGKNFKAIIVIPLMPGFESEIDAPEGGSVRVIMQCQYMSISQGETSIFGKLKKLNIDPLQYIQFFSLRKWAKLEDQLVTEQVYIHSKLLIVDDRSVIIGSANINERSMAGSRDSEMAVVIRDTEYVQSTMDGEPYQASKFALELRQRLMREHLGCDVDLIDVVERRFARLERIARSNCRTLATCDGDGEAMASSAMVELASREVLETNCSSKWSAKHGSVPNFGVETLFAAEERLEDGDLPEHMQQTDKVPLPASYKCSVTYQSFNNRAGLQNMGLQDKKTFSRDARLKSNAAHEEDVEGNGPDAPRAPHDKQTNKRILEQWALETFSTRLDSPHGVLREQRTLPHRDNLVSYLDSDADDELKWDMLKRVTYMQMLAFKQKGSVYEHSGSAAEQDNADEIVDRMMPAIPSKQLFNMNFLDPWAFDDPIDHTFYNDLWFGIATRNTLLYRMVFHCQPDSSVTTWKEYKDFVKLANDFNESQSEKDAAPANPTEAPMFHPEGSSENALEPQTQSTDMKLKLGLLTGSYEKIYNKKTAEKLLQKVNGHLVVFPVEWLWRELVGQNWFYNADRLPPIDIYD